MLISKHFDIPTFFNNDFVMTLLVYLLPLRSLSEEEMSYVCRNKPRVSWRVSCRDRFKS